MPRVGPYHLSLSSPARKRRTLFGPTESVPPPVAGEPRRPSDGGGSFCWLAHNQWQQQNQQKPIGYSPVPRPLARTAPHAALPASCCRGQQNMEIYRGAEEVSTTWRSSAAGLPMPARTETSWSRLLQHFVGLFEQHIFGAGRSWGSLGEWPSRHYRSAGYQLLHTIRPPAGQKCDACDVAVLAARHVVPRFNGPRFAFQREPPRCVLRFDLERRSPPGAHARVATRRNDAAGAVARRVIDCQHAKQPAVSWRNAILDAGAPSSGSALRFSVAPRTSPAKQHLWVVWRGVIWLFFPPLSGRSFWGGRNTLM